MEASDARGGAEGSSGKRDPGLLVTLYSPRLIQCGAYYAMYQLARAFVNSFDIHFMLSEKQQPDSFYFVLLFF